MIRRFLHGAGLVFRGFGLWRRRPGLMLLGMVPALIVFAAIVALLVALALSASALVEAMTPFAEGWDEAWRSLLRLALETVIFLGAVVIAVVTYTGITLAVGDWFYERIWRETEHELGGAVPAGGIGFWRALGDGLALIGLGILLSIVVAVVGLVPVIGAVAGPVLGVIVAGRLLAAELVTRPLEARGLGGPARREALRGQRAALLGFGVVTQLFFLVPLGAILVMPAAVAGSTMLAREALPAPGNPVGDPA